MAPNRSLRLALPLSWLVAGCGESVVTPPPAPPPPPPSLELGCAGTTAVDLRQGEAYLVAAGDGARCLRLTAGAAPAEYLVAVVSGASARTGTGILGGFEIRGRPAPAVATAVSEATAPWFADADPARLFHANLRRIEAARTPLTVDAPGLAPAARAPQIGVQRQFNVCGSISCDGFVPVIAEARYVGQSAVLYTEIGLPSGGFDEEELRRTGELIDHFIVPLDTANFGRLSDIDGDGLVNVVLTKAVNQLTPVCLGGVIVGYFLGTDLVPAAAGSNATEVVYIGVPDPNGEVGCRVTKDFFARLLGPTIMHELQHLISYNQHVLLRQGPVEHEWLNEALSHYAEELGGRNIPNSSCYLNDCLSQFAVPTLTNAYRYLLDPGAAFLVYPEFSTGSLAERGAAWLFLRWLSDHFGGTQAFTRGLLETTATGSDNLARRVSVPWPTLVAEWHLANWLDDYPGVTPANTRLRYTSWNLRQMFASFRAQAPTIYPRSFPLVPDSLGPAFDRAGILRGGSARFYRVVIDPASSPVDFRVAGAGAGAAAGQLMLQVAIARTR